MIKYLNNKSQRKKTMIKILQELFPKLYKEDKINLE